MFHVQILPWKLLLRRNLLLKIYSAKSTPKIVLQTAVFCNENMYPLLKCNLCSYSKSQIAWEGPKPRADLPRSR